MTTPTPQQPESLRWERARKNGSSGGPLLADAFADGLLVARIIARTRWGLNRKMRRAEKTHRRLSA